jgi:hypothetical protein
MVAHEETCIKCGKKFIIGGVLPQSICEQCLILDNKYWGVKGLDENEDKGKDDCDQNPI